MDRIDAMTRCINSTFSILNSAYMAKLSPKNNTNVHYKVKENGEWGYHINKDFGDVACYMIENDLTKIIDLGAGVGHGIEILNKMGFYARGYENEDILIEENANLFGNGVSLLIQKNDIMTLVKEDIKDFEVLYFYEPFKDNISTKKFIDNLLKIIMPKQTILYKAHRRKGGIINGFLSYKSLQVFKK